MSAEINNVVSNAPLIAFIIGIFTVITYGIKFGKHLWCRWIDWDDNRTDHRIKDAMGRYDKDELDKIIQDLCAKISDDTSHDNYDKIIEDVGKLKGAVEVLSGRKLG